MNTSVQPKVAYKGNDRLLFGIIMGVIAFWLFAQTTLNIAPDMGRDLGMDASMMNVAVAITSLFSGIFIVVMGGLADRVGRLKITRIGFYLSIAGSLLVAITPQGRLAAPVMLLGRALQGLSAACIMPASLALVKAFWDGPERQRAISMWSIGSWGGSGLCALFGGLMSQHFGWRSIFWVAIAVSVLGLWMMHGTPESKAETTGEYKFDLTGVLTFMVTMVALQVLVTQGNNLGWASPVGLALLAVTAVFGWLFLRIENKALNAFFDFSLFKNATYTGATISNFLINGTAGTLIVSLQLVQIGGGMNAQQAGFLTLGYAIAIIAFIRVGEKLLQRFGPRKPMIWGCLITGLAILMVSPANLLLSDYKILASVGYALFGVGLAFYATPSTDAALSNLPAAQTGSGSGIYKMASSLGAAFGVGISAAIFTALSGDSASMNWLEGVITFSGRQDNLAVREAAIVALGFNVLMVVMAILSIMLTVPKGAKAQA
ncbi:MULTISPECIES: MFS transporter [unclassified Simplicispira]|uniref:MFS transporter n=1 Tax=unclassified Simplicispira TaxID=2630407 RepID=UPI000D5EE670|nr:MULTISPECIES: MFS transporter [unclassified Simplicispira]PVY55235.1 DHA2 family multidrug resistance protein-like MFS transporter [Simplicispira sp. 125]REG16178.1 DHA2 family multidrug resistance protein-like MFS transporter [Simplicispira sp. 110]